MSHAVEKLYGYCVISIKSRNRKHIFLILVHFNLILRATPNHINVPRSLLSSY